MRPTLVIRPMSQGDVESILSLIAAAPALPRWPPSAYQKILERDPAAAVSRIALVCEIAAQEVAIGGNAQLGGRTLAGAAVASLLHLEALAELEIIVVRPGLQRLGAGSALLRGLADAACRAGARAMRLEVRESNLPARALYRKEGFRETGRRRSYYSAPEEDALIFERLL